MAVVTDTVIPPSTYELSHIADPNDRFFGRLSPEPYFPMGGDSTVDRMLKKRGSGRKGPPTVVFIHAGAGYHSTQNESVHLDVCAKAAQAAMTILNNNGTAVEAVELAIKVLEDREITNAGFGSNLSVNGLVECDATVVDHLGRSGACGAVPGIKNPISLAKLILDKSSKTLSLRRVPPNILVGAGAQKFAAEHGVRIVHNDELISKNAWDRYKRWCEDLQKAEAKAVSKVPVNYHRASAARSLTPMDYDKEPMEATGGQQRDHVSAILTGTWNEGQPDSPAVPSSPDESLQHWNTNKSHMPISDHRTSPTRSTKPHDRSPLSVFGRYPSSSKSSNARGNKRRRISSNSYHEDETVRFPSETSTATIVADANHDASSSHDRSVMDPVKGASMGLSEGPEHATGETNGYWDEASSDLIDLAGTGADHNQDLITDTVGAIAIDCHGNIAAGSSSGGIGMKHSGRIGPAALIGIGSAVIPCDPDDEEKKSVATVTSGTGEHMATTMASYKCAERLYHNTCRAIGGGAAEEWDEDTVMESFVTKDFMDHPGVKNQCSAGAIGVMAVKKTKNGFYLHFAHNTDSFALCSMASTDQEPLCVMSRLGKNRTVSRGARKIHLD